MIELNETQRSLIIFAVGAIAGAVCGVLGTRGYFKAKYEEEAEAEISEMRDYTNKKKERLDQLEKEQRERENYRSKIFENAYDDSEDDDAPEGTHVVTDEERDYLEGQEISSKRSNVIKLIPVDAYGSEPGFDVGTLFYYTEDDILATEEEERIDNPEFYVGNCLDKFGFRDNDESSIYIRNYRVQYDYEICKVRSSFEETCGHNGRVTR